MKSFLVNGAAPSIQIIKPFDEAFEVMKRTLFQPFDLKKWFVIGFAAWLSNLGSGNYNLNLKGNRNDWQVIPGVQGVLDSISGIPHPMLIAGIVVFILFILLLIVLFAWLRSRGRFIFIDCIVKNRGEIAQPWREYRTEGNSYFLFSLAVAVVMTLILTAAATPFMLPIIRSGWARPHFHDVYVICTIVLWAALFALLVTAWILISHLMIAVMYRRRCLARDGFRAVVFLITNFPGEITLYCLFWIALAVAAMITSCVVILSTCCIALLPYIGTVIMLPIFVVLRAFGLCFIRQFGSDYDVWAVVVPPVGTLPPTPPPPPLAS